MTYGVALVDPKTYFTTAAGAPLANGKVYVYVAGSTTPTPTWQDEGLTTLNTNPIVLDSRGQCVIWADPNVTYKFELQNAGGVVQYTVDNVKGAEPSNLLRALLATSVGASMIGFINSGSGTVARTVEDRMWERRSIFDYLTPNERNNVRSGTGTTDITAKVQAAINSSIVYSGSPYWGGLELEVPEGRYRIAGALTSAHSGLRFVGNGSKASVWLCESGATTLTYSDSASTDVSVGRFSMSKMSMWATSAAAKATGIGLDITRMFDAVWEDFEMYEFFKNKKMQSCFSNLFLGNHHFTSPVSLTLDAGCVGNKWLGGTQRLTSISNLGYSTSFDTIDFEPQWDGKTNEFGNLATVRNCYFEPVTTAKVPFMRFGSDCNFDNCIVAWGVAARPDTFLIEITGERNKILNIATSYIDRVFKFTTTSRGNELEFDVNHVPVASGAEMYASYPVLDLGLGNKITYKSRNGGESTTHGLYDNLIEATGNRRWQTFCRTVAEFNLNNLTSVATTAVLDPFGGTNAWLDTITGAAPGFTYAPRSYVADGVLYWSSSCWFYIPTGSGVTGILVCSGQYGVGRYLTFADGDLVHDQWIRLTQVSQPPNGVDIFPGFLVAGAIASTLYHAYDTEYEGQNPGTPMGNSGFNNLSLGRVSWDGAWKANTFTAGDYTASTGACTLTSPDMTVYRYAIENNTMHINLRLDTFTLSNPCAFVGVKLPEGRVAKSASDGDSFAFEQGVGWSRGFVETVAGSPIVRFYVDYLALSWLAGVDNHTLAAQLTIELQP